MTERDYLEFERAAEGRHELVNGEVIARSVGQSSAESDDAPRAGLVVAVAGP